MDDSSQDLKLGRSSRRGWSNTKKAVVAIAATVVILGIALGVGLGVGLTRKHHGGNNNEPGTGVNHSSNPLPTISREQLFGDQSRWIGSARDFTITDTPTTRVFNWTLSAGLATPGAMKKQMLLINGQSPGPVLEANLGDRIVVNVKNEISNATTIHWHGMRLMNEFWSDGANTFSQCGIPPGGQMTYNWTVQNVGTSWYHSHTGLQYTDGLYGAIILHSPNETAGRGYDDEVTLMCNDMYNTAADALMWRFTALGTGIDGQPGDEPSPDGGMINGVSQAKCAYIPASNMVLPERRRRLSGRSLTGGTLYEETNYCGDEATTYFNVTLEAAKTYRLRIVNPGTMTNAVFSIDSHNLTVVEADGVAVTPYNATSLNLAVAQRGSVLVTLDQPPGAYWIRMVTATDQLRYTGHGFNDTTLGVLRYRGIADNTLPLDVPAADGGEEFGPSTVWVPADKEDAPPPTVQQTVQFNMQYTADNQHYMFFNDSSWSEAEPWDAELLDVLNAPSSVISNTSALANTLEEQLSIINDGPGVMDLVVNSLDDGDHPFHLHGHTFWVMSHGDGHFTGNTASLNTTNPMRRDTVLIPSYGHAVLRFDTLNPGVWPFHCHLSWHMMIGLLLTVVNQPDQMKSWSLPPVVRQLCEAAKPLTQ